MANENQRENQRGNRQAQQQEQQPGRFFMVRNMGTGPINFPGVGLMGNTRESSLVLDENAMANLVAMHGPMGFEAYEVDREGKPADNAANLDEFVPEGMRQARQPRPENLGVDNVQERAGAEEASAEQDNPAAQQAREQRQKMEQAVSDADKNKSGASQAAEGQRPGASPQQGNPADKQPEKPGRATPNVNTQPGSTSTHETPGA